MDTGDLEAFLLVAERGSLTRAAPELGLTQSGLSRRIQRLEQALEAPLLARTRGGVRLTPAGERFRAYAATTVEQSRAVRRELRDADTALTGELRIAASSTPGEFLVPEWAAEFVTRNPGVRPEIFIADSAVVEDEVRARRWDVGFVGACLDGRGLDHLPVADDEVVLATPAGHPFAARGAVALAELAGQPFLMREGGSGTAASVERALAARELRLPPSRTVMVLGSTQAIVSAVERGIGLGWVSSLALAGRSRELVVPVRLADVPVRRPLFLIRDARRALPPAAAAFV
ncbi:MAG TPA: LysR family transcriptional regulator, partial [Thermomicrobiales bacterium]|nr:LysR family transcriptional regulator [Thermomicrobiales bacterium]